MTQVLAGFCDVSEEFLNGFGSRFVNAKPGVKRPTSGLETAS